MEVPATGHRSAPVEEEKLSWEIGERWDPGAALSSVPCWAHLCYGRSAGTSQPNTALKASLSAVLGSTVWGATQASGSAGVNCAELRAFMELLYLCWGLLRQRACLHVADPYTHPYSVKLRALAAV